MTKLFLAGCAILLTANLLKSQELVVHEWGTFTTLQGSDGKRLPGLYLEEEHLPRFVHSHQGFSPNPEVRDKGLYKPAENVTVKMETPVLYFYSPVEMNFTANVKFPAGTISQWYPQRTDGEKDNTETIDFAQKYNGWIQWDGKVLVPNSQQALSPDPAELVKTWTAPRETDANRVTVAGETEKHLFYRGVGHFDVQLHTSFNAQGQLVLRNLGTEDIPYVFVYDRAEKENAASVWWTGKLSAGEERIVVPGITYLTEAQLGEKLLQFENAFAAGLYQKESAAMLKTWNASYFQHSGLRVFWIVPERATEEILPLQISPKPAEIKRVLVGRSEVLTPEFEQDLLYYFAAGKFEEVWKNDRYYLAYKSRIEAITQATSVSGDYFDSKEVEILPNPTSGQFTVKANIPEASTISIRIINARGEMIHLLNANLNDGVLAQPVNLQDFPSGAYFLTIDTGIKRLFKKIVKN